MDSIEPVFPCIDCITLPLCISRYDGRDSSLLNLCLNCILLDKYVFFDNFYWDFEHKYVALKFFNKKFKDKTF